jgi:hypothetical protein
MLLMSHLSLAWVQDDGTPCRTSRYTPDGRSQTSATSSALHGSVPSSSPSSFKIASSQIDQDTTLLIIAAVASARLASAATRCCLARAASMSRLGRVSRRLKTCTLPVGMRAKDLFGTVTVFSVDNGYETWTATRASCCAAVWRLGDTWENPGASCRCCQATVVKSMNRCRGRCVTR